MLERLSDKALRVLLERGKTTGAAPFIRPPRGMIALREEGYRRGITMTWADEHYLRQARVWEAGGAGETA
jgi:hypothetical protein